MFFEGKKVLITGGTGTIGKSIARHLIKEYPDSIYIFSRDEFKQQQLQEELGFNEMFHFIIGDVRDYDSIATAMEGIDYVFHLAAMKRVDSCEHNPYEAVKTNVQGTNNVIRAALEHQVKRVIFTSSDKAISPPNTYGATKLIGERMISATELNRTDNQTIFSSVRFGNVMGSRGSVIPLFKEQILKEKKIKVTDLDMTRFMMTPDQATELTIKALQEAKGGEIFVLKMPVIKLGDLVDVLIDEIARQYNINQSEIDIESIGVRPGEKMFEELMSYEESTYARELSEMYIIPRRSSDVTYPNTKEVLNGTYTSERQQPLNHEELRSLLKKAKFL
ncbi:SDR family NAD(P)-dependent oxidoreductase [Alkalibacillus almallahensis]|uniref:SDR family NAD(P)-dependent oxidoreductase n=1 Tax=Alkalibacillus almallahensis TaxID=1379154 RepID=UPI001420C26F|nr:FlaA1/EpsC-like NDP-sugar epimerase [Alkalibacillus almallahensis]